MAISALCERACRSEAIPLRPPNTKNNGLNPDLARIAGKIWRGMVVPCVSEHAGPKPLPCDHQALRNE
eukprot:1158825-Pelagomonas_calceolata.AAC.2